MYPWLSRYWQDWLAGFNAGRLSHAWLLSGPQGLGKLALARRMAQTLLCQHPSANGACGLCHACTLDARDHHPDLQRVGMEDSRSLGVDLIRDLIGTLNSSAQLGGAKVVILARAESMTEAAANALLKTLEEPAGRSHLILISDRPSRLLPTILSRCQKIPLRQPEPEEILPWLHQQQGGQGASWQHLQLNQHAPLQTLEYLQTGQDQQRRDLLGALDNAMQQPVCLPEFISAMQANPIRAQRWLHALLLDALKCQAGADLTTALMADQPDLLARLVRMPTAHLLGCLTRWQQLGAVPDGMPTSMPSLHFTHWFNQLIAEEC